MATTTYYAEYGVRTKQGIYAMLVIMVLVAANVIAFYGVRTSDMRRTITAMVWIVAVAAATVRNLRQLDTLEKDHPEPTNAMRLIFQLAATQPVLGIVPLLIGLR